MTASLASGPALPARLGVRLAVMFALEIASLAAYAPLLSLHARRGLGLGALETSLLFATGPLAALLAPLVAGWLADRVLRANLALSATNVLRGLSLVLAARATGFGSLAAAMLLHGFFSAAAFVFSNTVALHHLPDARRLGSSRLWGTASWIAMVWAVSAWLDRAGEGALQLARLRLTFDIGAACAFAAAAYALTLPRTPTAPPRSGALHRALLGRLLRLPGIRSLLLVALLWGSLGQLNLMLQGLYFGSPDGLGLAPAAAARATTVCQLLELALFPALAPLVRRFGLRAVVIAGVAAWPARYLAYFVGAPAWLVIGAQLLHGINFVLGFAGLQLAVELAAPRGLRASAQGAFMASLYGVGNLGGQLACGLLLHASALPGGGQDWRRVFAAPLLLSVVATVIAVLAVHPRDERLDEGPELKPPDR